MEIITKDAHKALLKRMLHDGAAPDFIRISAELSAEAEIRMRNPLYSVTFTKSRAVSGDPHDFYTEAPYWWPDPANPGGPFIRRDGEYYPERMDTHRRHLTALSDDVYILSIAGFLFDRQDCIDRAKTLLETWFLDPATKMNPHLEYAQAISGITDGRGIGIIDTAALIRLISAMDYFTLCPGTSDTVAGLREWFAAYLTWLDTSKKGIEEREYPNNHSSWWTAQAAAYAAFIGDEAMLQRCFTRLTERILPRQTREDGSFINEMERTRSLFYSLFNLNACAVTAEIAHNRGVDLWNAVCEGGRGIPKSLAFYHPYYENPLLWTHRQINYENPGVNIAFQLAAVRVSDAYDRVNTIRREGYRFFALPGHLGAPCMLEGYFPTQSSQ